MAKETPIPGNNSGLLDDKFPHGYDPRTAAFHIAEMLEAADQLNVGAGSHEASVRGIIQAAAALAWALGEALDRAHESYDFTT